MKNLNYSLILLLFVNVDIFSDCCPKKDNYEGESSSSIDNMLKDITKKRNTNLDDEPYKNLYDTNKLLTNYFNSSPLTGTKIEKDSTDHSKLNNTSIIDDDFDKQMKEVNNVKSGPTNEEKMEILKKIAERREIVQCLNNIIVFFIDTESELREKAGVIRNIYNLCVEYIKGYILSSYKVDFYLQKNNVDASEKLKNDLEGAKKLLKEQYENFKNDLGGDGIIKKYDFNTVNGIVTGKLNEYNGLLKKYKGLFEANDKSEDKINHYKEQKEEIVKKIKVILELCNSIKFYYDSFKRKEVEIKTILGEE